MADDIQLFIDRLNQLSSKSFEFAKKHREAGREKGLAYYHYGRYVSCFMGVKTLLFSHKLAGSEIDFAAKYIRDLPEIFPIKDLPIAQRYMKETYMAIRFVLFQNLYSQTEFTFRIIQRSKLPDDKRNPFKLISTEFGIMKGDMPSFLIDVRNSIHNNGHYFPNNKTDKEYAFLQKQFKFEVGKPIEDVTMNDILDICDYLLDETDKLFENEELASINFN